MDFDSAFSKTERYNWADEVEREFSVAGTEDKFSQCSQDTWLYYSTSSSLPCDDVLRPRPRARSSGRSRHRKRNKNKASKASGNGCQPDKSAATEITRSVSEGPCSKAVVAMVQSRRKDFESCAKGHAWSSNFDAHKKQHEEKTGAKKEAMIKSKEKQRKEVCHQVKDGPVLIVTRRSKTSSKAQTPTPIKQTKKPKSHPQPSPPISRMSRADSSSDWKSDKRTASEAETSSVRIEIAPFQRSDTILDRRDMQVMTKVESQ